MLYLFLILEKLRTDCSVLVDSRYPDLFQSINPEDVPTTLDTSSLLSIVLASASSYPSTASRLTSILDVPVPSADLSAQLIDLQPRIAEVEALQERQTAELAVLRGRTAAVLQRWYTVDVLRAGESLAELEGRVEGVEKEVRRAERARRVDEEMA